MQIHAHTRICELFCFSCFYFKDKINGNPNDTTVNVKQEGYLIKPVVCWLKCVVLDMCICCFLLLRHVSKLNVRRPDETIMRWGGLDRSFHYIQQCDCRLPRPMFHTSMAWPSVINHISIWTEGTNHDPLLTVCDYVYREQRSIATSYIAGI